MTEAMKEAVIKAVRENPDKTYREIAQLHGVPMAQVSVWERQAGIRRKAPRGEGRIRGLGKLWNVEEDSLENSVREKEAELARLKQELANQLREIIATSRVTAAKSAMSNEGIPTVGRDFSEKLSNK